MRRPNLTAKRGWVGNRSAFGVATAPGTIPEMARGQDPLTTTVGET